MQKYDLNSGKLFILTKFFEDKFLISLTILNDAKSIKTTDLFSVMHESILYLEQTDISTILSLIK